MCRVCEQLAELPHGGKRYYYPGAMTEGGRDGVLVRITPFSRDAWVGVFAFGHYGKTGKSGIFTFPEPSVVCVVASGDGYLVTADDPTNWQQIAVYPICEVIPAPSKNLIIFASHTHMPAFGSAGVAWRSKRLAWSDMRITQVTPTHIEGETWDIRSEENIAFAVDIATGEHKGGIEEA
jgi:hypothetical protein